jgi:FMN phosphatase YigB (HAD superfamily)
MRSIRAIGFDLDGTLVKQNSWAELYAVIGVSADEDWYWHSMYHAGSVAI